MKKWNQKYHDKFKKHSLINQVWNERNLEKAWKRAKEILERELKLKLNPEKTRIVQTKKGVEFLGFHFNGRWRRPRDKAKKKFKDKIKHKTRRQQPKSLVEVIQSINPLIRSWGNYFKGGTVKTIFKQLDAYIRGRLRCYKTKSRNLKVILHYPNPN